MNIWIKSILLTALVVAGGLLMTQIPIALAYIMTHWPMHFKIGLGILFFMALVLMWRGILDK
jgi:cytochrome b561